MTFFIFFLEGGGVEATTLCLCNELAAQQMVAIASARGMFMYIGCRFALHCCG